VNRANIRFRHFSRPLALASCTGADPHAHRLRRPISPRRRP
jgi:hypothetical protein